MQNGEYFTGEVRFKVKVPSFSFVTTSQLNALRARAQSERRTLLPQSDEDVLKDGQHPIIEMECGPVRHRADAKKMDAFTAFRHVVRVRPTPFVPKTDALECEGEAKFADIVASLAVDASRSEMIARDVAECVREGRSPVVISKRRSHLDVLERLLTGTADRIVVMRGGAGRRKLKALRDELDSIPKEESRIILATGSYVGEGFDDARLDTLFLTLPISWRGRLVQYAGRLHRQCDGKREVRIYDYLDQRVAMCSKMFNRRAAGYRDIGYEIVMTNDSLSGWPEGVELPVALREDETYADCAPRRGLRSRSTEHSTSRTQSTTAATGARTISCRRAAILSFVSCPTTSPLGFLECWTT